MAKNKNETVKVKFIAATAYAGKVRAKGSTLEVSEDDALALVDGKHAELEKTE